MPAYVIARITVTDAEPYQRYLGAFRDVLAGSGSGGEIVAVGAPEVLEGAEPHAKVAMIRFPSADAARAWYHSAEYQKISEDRRAGATVDMVLVEMPS